MLNNCIYIYLDVFISGFSEGHLNSRGSIDFKIWHFHFKITLGISYLFKLKVRG